MPVSLVSEGRIGRFDLRGLLGRGGAGDVHLAYDPDRQSLIALKLIRIGLDPEMLEAERRGVSLQQRLQSKVPQIAAIFDFGDADGFFFVAMEYVEGVDLADVLKQGPLATAKAVDIAIQLCAILESMERVSKDLEERGRRVIHSDIKPANVRLQEGDRVRLLDFGVAKSVTLSKKFTRNVFGSTPYLAPERLANEVVDSHTDLWAVSVVLYEMLADYVPFQGETTDAVERWIRSGQPPAPLPADCPAPLKSILSRSLCADPALRFPDAATLRRHLEAFRDGRPLAISEPTRKILAVRQETAPPPTPQQVAIRQENGKDGGGGQVPAKAGEAEDGRGRGGREVRSSRRRPRFWHAWVRILVALLTLLVAAHAYAYYEAGKIRRALASSSDPELPALCDRYDWASSFDPLGIFLDDTRRELKIAVLHVADRAFDSFRRDTATTAKEWEQSRSFLEKASILDSGDEVVLAKLAFCGAQIARLQAEQLSAANDPAAKSGWKQAVEKLEEAVRLAPEVVESYAALAQIYIDERSGLYDFKKLKWALEELEKRGVPYSDREKRHYAGAYHREGRALYQRAKKVDNEAEKASLLGGAVSQFNEAAKWCRQLAAADADGTYVCRDATAYLELAQEQLGALGYVNTSGH
jgi:hypothetical protein